MGGAATCVRQSPEAAALVGEPTARQDEGLNFTLNYYNNKVRDDLVYLPGFNDVSDIISYGPNALTYYYFLFSVVINSLNILFYFLLKFLLIMYVVYGNIFTGGRQSCPVLTATSQSNGNGQNSTPHRIQTP